MGSGVIVGQAVSLKRMRAALLLLPAMLMAQTTQTSTQAPHAAAKPATRKPAVTKPKPAAPALTTDDEKTIYALGLSIARSIAQFDLSPAELDIVKRALTDGTSGKPAEELQTWGPKIQPFAQARSARVAEREKVASNAYLTKAASEPGAVKTDSGLIYRELRPGTGASPVATDTVKVNYRGTLVDGKEFDSSYARNEPAQFALGSVVKCWTEGVQKMKVGGKAQLVCPSGLAYGDTGRPGIPGGATLVFEIELLDIVSGAK
jgi:FKBP-type peptidyl-prolyl cis-trans isomerase FkpA